MTDQKRVKKQADTNGMKGVVNASKSTKANVDNSDNSNGDTLNPVGNVQVCCHCTIHEFTLIELILTEFIYFVRSEEEQEECRYS
jgi:hypothetical protein